MQASQVTKIGDFLGIVVWQFFTLGALGDLHLTIEERKQLGTCKSRCGTRGELCD